MSKSRKHRGPTERYVSLRYWLIRSAAWKSLPGMARALYLELAERYNGCNNGRISYSVREGAEALHISKSTSKQLLDLLKDRGFLVCTKRGAFSLKATRDASEWRLTEHPNDTPPGHATKEFMRWQPREADSNQEPKFKTRFAHGTRTVRQGYPYGSATSTVGPEKTSDGSATVPVEAENPSPTVRSEVHIQLPGTDSGGERSAPEGSAVASEPPEWRQLGYPPGSPSHDEVLATLERQAQERGRARPPRQAGGRSR
jgi:hypothetical protein